MRVAGEGLRRDELGSMAVAVDDNLDWKIPSMEMFGSWAKFIHVLVDCATKSWRDFC